MSFLLQEARLLQLVPLVLMNWTSTHANRVQRFCYVCCLFLRLYLFCRTAIEHSTDMAVNAYFSHVGTGNRSLQERAESFGFDTFPLGENIAAGYNSVRAVVLAWMW